MYVHNFHHCKVHILFLSPTQLSMPDRFNNALNLYEPLSLDLKYGFTPVFEKKVESP